MGLVNPQKKIAKLSVSKKLRNGRAFFSYGGNKPCIYKLVGLSYHSMLILRVLLVVLLKKKKTSTIIKRKLIRPGTSEQNMSIQSI